jgi:hypothetical protein
LKAREVLFLLLLTAGGFFVLGYHPYADDATFYIPAVKKLLDPSLYPRSAEFFESHARLTLFPNFVAWTVRVLHLSLGAVLLLLHVAALFLFLLACWKVSCLCFERPEARWCAVTVVAATLTVPVTGTALFLFDTFLNPRSISAFAVMFAVAAALEERYVSAGFWLVAAGIVHPLMPVYGVFFILLLAWNRRGERVAVPAARTAAPAVAPLGISFDPPTPAYHQAALRHNFHYVVKWEWYQWAGIFAPVGVFLWFHRIARERRLGNVALICRTLVPFALVSLAAALVLDIPARFEALARFQPLRSLYLTYVLMFILVGGMLGEFVLKRSPVRWLLLFVPLCAGLFAFQLHTYQASAHFEWPGATSRNQWVQAFDWVRQNTPRDAYFALNPLHMELAGEDVQSFRAIAERSMLADTVKDSGAVAMFPSLAEEWWDQVSAQDGWKAFQIADFERLKSRYGVDWVVVEQPGVAGLDCPYQNPAVRVCRLN